MVWLYRSPMPVRRVWRRGILLVQLISDFYLPFLRLEEEEGVGQHHVAKFLVPDWGDKVDSGIGFSYRPAGLHRLAERYDNPMPGSTISPSQGLWIWQPVVELKNNAAQNSGLRSSSTKRLHLITFLLVHLCTYCIKNPVISNIFTCAALIMNLCVITKYCNCHNRI